MKSQSEQALDPARCSQPAEPVYQVQPPRPTVRRASRCRRHDVGLDLVAMRLGPGSRVVDRVEHGEQLAPPCRPRRARRTPCTDPGRRVRVLAAVLADAGQVALDVARIERGLVERRREQQRQARRRGGSSCAIDRGHRRCGATGVAAPDSTAQDCAIESIWHSSFCSRAQRRAVVEVGRGDTSRRPRRSRSMAAASASACAAAASPRDRRRRAPRPAARSAAARRQEPAEPDALALAARRRRGSCRRSSRRSP